MSRVNIQPTEREKSASSMPDRTPKPESILHNQKEQLPINKWANEINRNFKEETQKPISVFICLFLFFMCSIFLAIREMQTKMTLRLHSA